MLEKCQGAQQRWGGVSEIIDSWLESRRKLISHFVSMPQQRITAGFTPALNGFCALLVDYISSGHFEVYEQLLREGSEFDDGSVDRAQDLFPLIQQTTDMALDFNDKFSNMQEPTVQQIREFAEELSQLGQALESRFSLEDEMIELLHHAHSDSTAAQP
ncbi:MAG: sigma D regulator [Pseudomonadales bacterium]